MAADSTAGLSIDRACPQEMDARTETVTVRDAAALGAQSQRCLRVKVTTP